MPLRHVLWLAAVSTGLAPLSAQDVLDQTEPTQAEEEPEIVEEAHSAPPELLPPDRPAPEIEPAIPDTPFEVTSISIAGNEALPDTQFVDIIEAYIARPLSRSDLAALAEAVAARARERGFVFATATIPVQRLDLGMLRVVLDEGRVDVIEIDGDDDPAIRSQLEPLRNGGPITRARLERRLLLADDISGVRILDTRYEKDGEVGRLIVRTRRSRAHGEIELRNNGSDPVGPIRAQIAVDLNGLLDPADEVDVTVGITPFEPGELQFARAAYRIRAGSNGLELGGSASYSRTEPGAFLEERDISGRYWRAGIEASYPVLRSRDTSVWLIGGLDVTDLRQTRFSEVARHDRVPAIRAGVYSRGRLAGGRYRGRLTLSRGLDILDATDPGDPLASRSDASAHFTSLSGWFAWDRPIGDNLGIALGGRGQLAADPLLATEDLGMGGTSFLRGYRFNERTGDRGIMGYFELRYDWLGEGDWLREGQIYAFADGGTVSNLEAGLGGGSLASVGFGMRTDVNRDLELDLEFAIPLSGPRFDSDSEAPLLNVRVEQSF